MLIAIDIDEVLADTLNAFIKKYNNTFHTAFERGQFSEYDWWKVLGITFEDYRRIFLRFIDEGFFENLKPLLDAPVNVAKLKAGHSLVAVTSRASSLNDTTTKWLERFFPQAFSEVYNTRQLPLAAELESKYHICHRIGAHVLLEDYFEYAEDCAENGMRVFLFDAPWNQNIKPAPNMERVYSWKEVIGMIRSISD